MANSERERKTVANAAYFGDFLDNILDETQIGLWDWDLQTGKVVYSRQWEAIAGYGEGELPQDVSSWENAVLPEDLKKAEAAIERCLKGSVPSYQAEFRMARKDGSVIWAQDKGFATAWGEDGRPTRLMGVLQDVTARKAAEARLEQALAENESHNEHLREEVDSAVRHLRESQQTNQAMLDANPYVNIILDSGGQVLDCNPAAVEYFGFATKEDFLRDGIAKVVQSIPPTQPGGIPSIPLAQRIAGVAETGTLDFETELVIDGRRSPVRAIFNRIPYGNSFAVTVYLVDLRSLKEARSELLRQDHILREINRVSAKLMSAGTDEFDLTVWNSLRVLGQSVEADRMYIWQNFTSDEGALCCRQTYEWSEGAKPQSGKEFTIVSRFSEMPFWYATLSAGRAINMPVRLHRPGFERDTLESQDILSILVIPMFSGDSFWGFIGFDDCHTERYFSDMEEQILKSAAGIIVTAIQRNIATEDLIVAREAALASAKAKSEFLSRMSHEIRTPMNAIIGMTTIAKKSSDPAKVAYCLDRISTASTQLLEIINDILDMSKIESGKLELSPHPFDFEKMLQNILSVVQVRMEEKEQAFSLDFDGLFTRPVVADELRLSQVITNLLTNAVKFTPVGGNISLKVRHAPGEGKWQVLHVEVGDNGIGIAPDQVGRLFHSFEQADGGTTRKYGGTGLGLAICKSIVQMMGGDIRVESTVGQGSVFSFSVLFQWGEGLPGEVVVRAPRSDIRILAVDDSEDVRIYFKNILAGFALNCDLAASGGEAVEMVQAALDSGRPYELVFLDWKMPRMSGSETAAEIRRIMNDDVVVIMISVADWSEIEGEVKAYGVTHFLPKPILPSVLFNTIVNLTEYQPVQPQNGESRPAHDWTGRHILLVEDVDINREIILSILAETGVEIDCAVNGLDAVEKYTQSPQKYDLILMDVQMPELDGLGATRQIRASGKPGAATIPVLAMTANAFKQDMDSCLEAGMNDHVAKPIDVDILMGKLSRYLGGGI